MTYLKAHNYLNSFINYEYLQQYPYKSRFRLERMHKLLFSLGNPHFNLRTIQVAGSKGKGSTCCFLANILKAAGFKVGLYTSPHLIDVRERIRIVSSFEKEMISRKDFARLTNKIKPYADKLKKTKLGILTYYEILTALAFLHFTEQSCDFVVLETGIGGRLDATNVVSSLVCAFSPISYEHTKVLGNTLAKIAQEKAAIIKEKTQVVITAPQRPAALKIIRKTAKKVEASVIEVGKDVQLTRLKIGLLGRHQLVNATVAKVSALALDKFGFRISGEAIKQGLKNTRWPGRLETVSQKPRIVLDAAHNRASALALKLALSEFFKFDKLILVLGVSADKDVSGILKELAPGAARIILTKSKSPRAMEPAKIKSFIAKDGKPITLTDNLTEGLKLARQNANLDDLILVCGSLYLLGEVLKQKGDKKIIK